MNLYDFKKSFYSAIVFFGTLLLLSAAYAAYQTITAGEYATGTSVTSSLFGKLVGNIDNLNTRVTTIETGGSTPSGAVMAFNLATCPIGWIQADGSGGRPDLRGQFIRGLNTFDNGATTRADGKQDPNARTLGSWQNDALQNHRHFHGTDANGNGGYSNGANGNQSGAGGYQNNTTSLPMPITSGGVAIKTDTNETRPKNIALIYCIKS